MSEVLVQPTLIKDDRVFLCPLCGVRPDIYHFFKGRFTDERWDITCCCEHDEDLVTPMDSEKDGGFYQEARSYESLEQVIFYWNKMAGSHKKGAVEMKEKLKEALEKLQKAADEENEKEAWLALFEFMEKMADLTDTKADDILVGLAIRIMKRVLDID